MDGERDKSRSEGGARPGDGPGARMTAEGAKAPHQTATGL